MGRGSDNNLLYGPVPIRKTIDEHGFDPDQVSLFSPLIQPAILALNQEPDYRTIYDSNNQGQGLQPFDDYAHYHITKSGKMNIEYDNIYSGTVDLIFKGNKSNGGIPEFTRPRDVKYPSIESLNDYEFSRLDWRLSDIIEILDNNSRSQHPSPISIDVVGDHPSQGKILAITPTQPGNFYPSQYLPGDSLYVSLARMMAVEKQYGGSGQWKFYAFNSTVNEKGLFYSINGKDLAWVRANPDFE